MTDTQLHLLLVEDNELDARALTRRLDRLFGPAHSLDHHSTLAGGLEAATTNMFDCVLLDLSLPDSEGLLGVDAFLRESAGSPIIVLTGLDDPDVAVDAVERGAQDYLPKQLVDDELLGRSISYAITRHQAEVRLRVAHEQLEVLGDRERIARDLHDTVIQQLFATGMSLQAMTPSVTEPESRQRLVEAVDNIDDAIKGLREAIFGMRTVRDQPALEREIRRVITSNEGSLGHAPTFVIEGDLGEVVDTVASELIPTLSEALSNVARHAGATATEVRVHVGSDVRLVVSDNGGGVKNKADADGRRTGDGLRNMSNRALELGGSFRLGAGSGGGTRLVWEVKNSG